MSSRAGDTRADSSSPPIRLDHYDVFVSYHEADRNWVRGVLLPALDEADLTYIEEDAFPLGRPRHEATESAITDSDRVIAVLSTAYVESRHTNLVTLLTAQYGDTTATWPLIPVRRDDVRLPPRLAMLVPLDMREEELWDDQIERLRRELGVTRIHPRPIPPCPYPGMTPYGVEDADRFFGRSDDVDRMIDRLRTSSLMTVIGPSGCGKSSLVFAGLFPRLSSTTLGEAGQWQLVTVRPGADVSDAIAAAFDVDGDATPVTLAGAVRERAATTPVLLVVDQAEELFTRSGPGDSAGDPRRAATDEPAGHGPAAELAALLGLLDGETLVRTVLTIRADFYGQLMSSQLWDVVAPTRFDVRPLQPEGLREAIVEPAEDVGVYVERGLVERLVADAAAEPGLLPFVQETMRLLWDRIQRRLLTLAGYEALVITRPEYGGATYTGLQVAMALHADTAIGELDHVHAQTAQRILIRLVQFGQGRADVRQQQRVADLRSAAGSTEALEQVLEHLVERRLVTMSGAQDDPATRTVDLAHEALITGWPTFQRWLEERSGAERARRSFVELAERWQADLADGAARPRSFLGRAAGWLRGQDADRGLSAADLAEAERWLASEHAGEVGLDRSPITDLVEHSRSWHRSRTRFWRGLTAIVLVLALSVAAAAGVAWWLAGVAQDEARRALALLLAEASERPPEELDLSVLLALEAVERDPSVANRGALRTALEQSPQLERYLPARERPVLAVAASSDGRWLADAGEEPTIRLWDTDADPAQPVLLTGHADEVLTLSFDPAGEWLASGSRDDTVRVWDLDDPDGPPLVLTAAPADALVEDCRADEDLRFARDVRAVAFSPDGDVLAVAGHNGLVERYETDTWSSLPPLSGHRCDVTDLAYGPGGDVLASASRDDTVRLWDVDTGTTTTVLGRPTPRRNDDGDVRAVAWRPDGSALATAGNDGFVRLHDLSSGEVVVLGGHTARVFALAFDETGERLYSSSADRAISVWDPDAGPQASERLLGHRRPVRGLAPTPEGGLVSGGQDGQVEVWDVRREVRLGQQLTGVDEGATAVATGGDTVIAGLADGALVAWDLDTATAVGRSAVIDGTPVRDVVAIADGAAAAAVTASGTIGVWQPTSGTLRTWDTGGVEVRSLVHLEGTDRIVTADVTGTVRWWDLDTGAAVEQPVQLAGCSVVALAVAPDERQLIATCNEQDGRSIGLEDGAPRSVQVVDGIGRLSAAFTPSGSFLSGGGDGAMWLWRPGELGGEPTTRFEVVAGGVRALDVDQGEDRAVSVTDDLVHLWDLATGQRFGDPWRVGVRVRDAAFTDDGRRLAVVADPGIHLLLDVDPSSWPDAACELVGRDLTPTEWDQVVGTGEPTASCVP